MSYSARYRLNFGDDKGGSYKLEIHQKNYSGSVEDMIGAESPVVIEWTSEDDIYSPIIGSTCTIQLYTTDSVSYLNFYEYDEREFKVIVYAQISGFYSPIWNG